MYRDGEGAEKDEKRAVELFTLAADQGHPKAQFNLGIMYDEGQGVDKDEKRAFEFYTLDYLHNFLAMKFTACIIGL